MKFVLAASLAISFALAGPTVAAEGTANTGGAPHDAAAGGHEAISYPRLPWTFAGPTGHFDKAQLRRGYQVYREVCSACHGMKLLSYRNVVEAGGPGLTVDAATEIAAAVQVPSLDDAGEPATRPGRLADRFVSPWPNEQAAAAANGGAVPPDLSVMAKARGFTREAAWYMDPLHYISDIVTGYEEKGTDYIHALLTGYTEPPANMTMAPGMNYNRAFPGHQIAMAQPLQDGSVEFEDGSPNTIDAQTRDVTAFLMWAAEPKLEERKQLGLKVMLYLALLSLLLFLAKRAVWRDIKH